MPLVKISIPSFEAMHYNMFLNVGLFKPPWLTICCLAIHKKFVANFLALLINNCRYAMF